MQRKTKTMNSTLFSLVIVLLGVAATLSAPLGGRGGGRWRGPETRGEQRNYLRKYGHWRGPKDNGTDDDLRKSVRAFQRFFRLNVTGDVDNETKEMMANPRCGMPDDNETPGRRRRYVLFGTKWTTKKLTYFIQNFTPDLPSDVTRSDIAAAFKYWSDSTPLTFSESQTSSATFRIRFASGDHGDGNPFDGPGGILAHAFFPQVGNAHFDEDETWSHDSTSGTNLLQVAVHEFGHLLGLAHSTVRSAVMYPYFSYNSRFNLNSDDIGGIQALYGKPVLPTALPTVNVPIPPLAPGSTTSRTSTVSTATGPATRPVITTTTQTVITRRPNRRCPFYYYWFGWC